MIKATGTATASEEGMGMGVGVGFAGCCSHLPDVHDYGGVEADHERGKAYLQAALRLGETAWRYGGASVSGV
jgi:hypothetical protein